jgi:branched-chain amino acid aminotransferase
MKLAASFGLNVSEEPISIETLKAAVTDGSLKEMFITGTAATVITIEGFGHRGDYFDLEPRADHSLSARILETMDAIRTRKSSDPFGWVHPVPAR